MDLHLEIDRSKEPQESKAAAKEDLKEKVIALLEESDQAFEKITEKL